MQLRPVGYVR